MAVCHKTQLRVRSISTMFCDDSTRSNVCLAWMQELRIDHKALLVAGWPTFVILKIILWGKRQGCELRTSIGRLVRLGPKESVKGKDLR